MSDLIDVLEDLRVRLNKSGVERTTGLKKEMGDDCQYYRKSKDIFLQRDYDDLKQLTLSLVDQFRLIEGKDFAK